MHDGEKKEKDKQGREVSKAPSKAASRIWSRSMQARDRTYLLVCDGVCAFAFAGHCLFDHPRANIINSLSTCSPALDGWFIIPISFPSIAKHLSVYNIICERRPTHSPPSPSPTIRRN